MKPKYTYKRKRMIHVCQDIDGDCYPQTMHGVIVGNVVAYIMADESVCGYVYNDDERGEYRIALYTYPQTFRARGFKTLAEIKTFVFNYYAEGYDKRIRYLIK